MANTQRYSVSLSNPTQFEAGWKPEFREKKKVPAMVKTVDGQTLVGNLHIRNCNISLKDELNSDMETFIALTDVQDGKGGFMPFTFLLNFSKIIYVSVSGDTLDIQYQPENNLHTASLTRRKVEVYVRLEDGKVLAGKIHVRNSIKRTKDELNAKDGRFVLLTEVSSVKGQTVPDAYFINKDHVIYFAVGDDQLP